jgi:hypothetical protein
MPRLRKVKDYDFVVQEVSEDPSDTTDNNGTQPEQRGWWSNENIIASLPDAKLRETLNRHKLLWDLCQNEITRRHVQGIKVSGDQVFDIRAGRHLFRRVQPQASTTVAKNVRASRRTKQTQLSAKQMLQALEMLMKMKDVK